VTEDAALFQAMTADHGPLRCRTVITAVDMHCALGPPTCRHAASQLAMHVHYCPRRNVEKQHFDKWQIY